MTHSKCSFLTEVTEKCIKVAVLLELVVIKSTIKSEGERERIKIETESDAQEIKKVKRKKEQRKRKPRIP